MISVGGPIPRLLAVRPAGGRRVILTWEDYSIAKVELAEHLSKFRVFSPLADDGIFQTVVLDEWGWAIYWPSVPMAAVPTDVLSRLPAVEAGTKESTLAAEWLGTRR